MSDITPNIDPQSPTAELANMKIQQDKSFSKSLKVGDLLLILCGEDRSRQRMYLVTDISDPTGILQVVEPLFSVNRERGTWTMYGEDLFYEPYSKEKFWVPVSESRTKRYDFWTDLRANEIEHCEAPFGLPDLENGEEFIVNPPGTMVLKEYFQSRCPFCGGGGLFCPGCGGVSGIYPELFMSCGIPLACPVCHGMNFAEEDRRRLRYMEYECKKEEAKSLMIERCDILDQQRKKLDLKPIKWGPLE